MAAVSSVWPSPLAPNEFTDAPTHTACAMVAQHAQRAQDKTITRVVFTVILLTVILLSRAWLLPRDARSIRRGDCNFDITSRAAKNLCQNLCCLQRQRRTLETSGAYPRVVRPMMSALGWHFPLSLVGRTNRPLRWCIRIQSNRVKSLQRHTAVLEPSNYRRR